MRKIRLKWLFDFIVCIFAIVICFCFSIGVSDSIPPVIESLRNRVLAAMELQQHLEFQMTGLSKIGQLRIDELAGRLTHQHEFVAIRTVSPTCYTQGYTVYGCRCGYRYADNAVDMVPHMWGEWTTVRDPGMNVDGEKSHDCIWCGTTEYESIPKTNRADNYVGRLVIPSVQVNVGLFRQYSNEGEAIVDAWDSASLFYTATGCIVVGDHNNQGFDAIKWIQVGDTAAIQHVNGNIDNYVCVDVVQGHNNSEYLTDGDGNNLYDIYPGALLCYTCNSQWTSVTVIVFQPT